MLDRSKFLGVLEKMQRKGNNDMMNILDIFQILMSAMKIPISVSLDLALILQEDSSASAPQAL